MNQFEIGQEVMIRNDLAQGQWCNHENPLNGYESNFVAPEMVEFKGEKATILGYSVISNHYKLDVDSGAWNWTDEMLIACEEG